MTCASRILLIACALGCLPGAPVSAQSPQAWDDGFSHVMIGTDADLGLSHTLLPDNDGGLLLDADADGRLDVLVQDIVSSNLVQLLLLRNLGGGLFEDVSTDPAIVDANRCNLDSETIGWVDVDGDADLDMFLPVYPAWAVFPGPGNLFLRNNGRNASGEFTFTDATVGSGLGNPPNTARPEGAQFCDYDRDGDPDLFSNGTQVHLSAP